ncbi:MAG: FtsX-like permease family protein [Bacteroidales bacterium]|nr:FtsX-like permease family protein [Bacteroidales bacterium]
MRKTRISMVLNIIGMSVSLMVFLALFAQVWHDYRFNSNFEDYKNIYRFEMPVVYDVDDYTYSQGISRPYIEAFEACSPDIEVACDYKDIRGLELETVYSDVDGTVRKHEIAQVETDSSFPNVFSIEIVDGTLDEYNVKNAALISENHAKTIFGDRSPVGEHLTTEFNINEYKIVGVYKTLPENCSVINGLLVNEGDDDLSMPNYSLHCGFFRLRDGARAEDVLESIRMTFRNLVHDDAVAAGMGEKYEKDIYPNLRLTSLSDIHYSDDIRPGVKPYADSTQTLVLLSISILFLLIAVFNYINFAIASIPFTINEINVEKVYGASRGRLILVQLKNNFIICLVSFGIALGLMEAVAGSQFASFSCCSLAVGDNVPAIAIGLTVALVAALAGGLVSALYSTSFEPGMVLKGDFAISGKGTAFRRISMVSQFVLSCVFLICGLMISRQTDYMMQEDNGFISENVVRVNVNLWYRWHRCFDEFMKNPEIIDVTCGDSPMSEGLSSRSELMSKDNEPVWYSFRSGYDNYFDFFDFKLVDGRFPNKGEFGVAVINETFAATYPDYQIGNKIMSMYRQEYEIIGVVEDFNARPMMHEREPMIYHIDNLNCADMFFKFRSDDISETVKWIEKSLRDLVSSSGANGDEISVTSTYLKDDIENMYRKEIGQSRLINSSSILCLLIALIGVLGIVYFETQIMRREIAIRKVNGATTWEIIKSLLGKYVIVSSIGFLLAVPMSVVIMNMWLSRFAYHTDMSVWIFLLAYLIITALTAAVVLLRSYSAASENPVEALKKE